MDNIDHATKSANTNDNNAEFAATGFKPKRKFNGTKSKRNCYYCNSNDHLIKDCEKHKQFMSGAGNAKENTPTAWAAVFLGQSDGLNSHEWIFDSGASVHISNSRQSFTEFRDAHDKIKGLGGDSIISGFGTVKLNISGKDFTLQDVAYVPNSPLNIISVAKATVNGAKLIFTENEVRDSVTDAVYGLLDTDTMLFKVLTRDDEINGSYAYVSVDPPSLNQYELWHARLGHPALPTVQKLNKKFQLGIKHFGSSEDYISPCPTCKVTKAVKKINKKATRTTNRVLELLHTDVVGPLNISESEYQYFVTILDDYSRYNYVYPLVNKGDASAVIQNFIKIHESKLNSKVATIRSDNGGEYCSSEFHDFCTTNGIVHEFSVPYNSSQNGACERVQRTIEDKMRGLLAGGKVPFSLWTEALNTASYLLNRTLHSRFQYKITPFEKFTGTPPNYSHLKVFGSTAYVLIPTAYRSHKLENNGAVCTMVGYDPVHKAYRLYDLSKQKIVVANSCDFDEARFPLAEYDEVVVINAFGSGTRTGGFVQNSGSSISTHRGTTQSNNSKTFDDSFRSEDAQGSDDTNDHSSTICSISDGSILSTGSDCDQSVNHDQLSLASRSDHNAQASPSTDPKDTTDNDSHSNNADNSSKSIPSSPEFEYDHGFNERTLPEIKPLGADSILNSGEYISSEHTTGEKFDDRGYNDRFIVTPKKLTFKRPRSPSSSSSSSRPVSPNRFLAIAPDDEDITERSLVHYNTNHIQESREGTLVKHYDSTKDDTSNMMVTKNNIYDNENTVELISRPASKRIKGDDHINYAATAMVKISQNQSSDIILPTSPKSIDRNPHKNNWLESMGDELGSFKENDVYKVVRAPNGEKIVGSRWHYTVKSDNKLKSRIIAQGHKMVQGEDYTHSYSPVIRYDSVKMLLSLAGALNLKIATYDIKTAYLHSKLKEKVYLKIPYMGEGYEDKDNVWLLNKSVYGLPQSGLNWNELMTNFLTKEGFKVNSADNCVFYKSTPTGIVLIGLYVDDLLVLSNDTNNLYNFKKSLLTRFKISGGDEIEDFVQNKDKIESKFLGMNITQHNGVVELSSKDFINKVVKEFEADNNEELFPISNPMDPNLKLSKEDELMPDATKYRSICGKILFASVTTRPDICFATSQLTKYMQSPTVKAFKAAIKVLRYLKGTINLGIHYGDNNQDKGLITGYCDASYGTAENFKSVSGYMTKIAGAPVTWKSKTQNMTTLSSTESEYVSMVETSKEIVWLQQLLSIMNIPGANETINIYQDNESARLLSEHPNFHSRSKHISIRLHYIRELVHEKVVKFIHQNGQDLSADIFTKALSKGKFIHLRDLLGLRNCT
ncbi:Gag-Pol polyprotein [Wickerhamomyces ciferrii]|uniref:Gag-Pol polyprotein n=1 Tax=Wickerhamomyces ciferrii (strain ATCC 14091 / BCRC 22168 / CBS 111 / JCM 3599 / NBRC 0793 / NRRL Y-1031 F-60-10) TaxID=1206466 RepID=K0L0G8_WICCF|nr:Gag-Pol polyprotein [Wickerhamomyces ciferrii]CCH47074.1 Gag-Pol polyprotein [Wickerhamomyces ciferrii]